MKKFRPFLHVGVYIFFLLGYSIINCFAQEMSGKSSAKVLLFDYLNTAAPRLDCYYTVEALNRRSEDAYNHAFINNDQTIKTIPCSLPIFEDNCMGSGFFKTNITRALFTL